VKILPEDVVSPPGDVIRNQLITPTPRLCPAFNKLRITVLPLSPWLLQVSVHGNWECRTSNCFRNYSFLPSKRGDSCRAELIQILIGE
jgi:hypothetical protein